jgi:hypothetical protein
MSRFQASVLGSKRGVFLHQAIDTIPQFTIFFLQFQHMCIQLFITLVALL